MTEEERNRLVAEIIDKLVVHEGDWERPPAGYYDTIINGHVVAIFPDDSGKIKIEGYQYQVPEKSRMRLRKVMEGLRLVCLDERDRLLVKVAKES